MRTHIINGPVVVGALILVGAFAWMFLDHKPRNQADPWPKYLSVAAGTIVLGYGAFFHGSGGSRLKKPGTRTWDD